jgi:predicted Holliday junction resolvase-like endonuclease
MDFLLEFFLAAATISLLILTFKLKDSKLNADSLKEQANSLRDQLNTSKASHDLRESNLHRTISGLQDVLSEEQKSIKAKELELKNQEAAHLKSISTVEKNLEEETESRKKTLSQKKSSEVRLGHIAETLAPFLDQFDFDPENCTFLGKPIDYISFDDDAVTLIEIKSGKSQLNAKQRHIRDLVKNNQVNWKEIRIQ